MQISTAIAECPNIDRADELTADDALPAISHSRVATMAHATPGTAAGTRPTISRSNASTIRPVVHSTTHRPSRPSPRPSIPADPARSDTDSRALRRSSRRSARSVSVAAGAQGADAELLLHDPMIVGRRPSHRIARCRTPAEHDPQRGAARSNTTPSPPKHRSLARIVTRPTVATRLGNLTMAKIGSRSRSVAASRPRGP